jgi:hypothetical protein
VDTDKNFMHMSKQGQAVRLKLSLRYFSQDRASCGDDVDKACGAVSLANSLMLRADRPLELSTPESIIHMSSQLPLGRLRDRFGISPDELCALSVLAGQSYELQASLCEPCRVSQLAAGDLMYVNSIALKNAQGGVQFLDAENDSHIVMVESVDPTGIVVINPDCRKCGSGFRHDIWGRMHISQMHLDKVWMSIRSDGTCTRRAAVLLRAFNTIPDTVQTASDGPTVTKQHFPY